MDDYIGHIIMFGGNFAIRQYSTCAGQLIAINSNTALFSLIGTTYGGDGRTTFGLPDFRGRSPIGVGHGPGLQNYNWGQRGGFEYVTLNQLEIPQHNHAVIANPGQSSHLQLSTDTAVRETPAAGDVPAKGNFSPGLGQTTEVMNYGPSTNTVNGQELPGFNPSSVQIGFTGGSQAHENRSPYLAVYFLICMYGIYPSRS